MLASNERDCSYVIETMAMLLNLIEWIGAELGIEFEFINIGGGLGIPYRPEESQFDVQRLGAESTQLIADFRSKLGYAPKLYMESGRYITGPHGVLVTRVINRKEIYRTYIGVDACMSALCVPACTVRITILKYWVKTAVTAWKWSMSSAHCAKTTINLPYSVNCLLASTVIYLSFKTPVHTPLPWVLITTANYAHRN